MMPTIALLLAGACAGADESAVFEADFNAPEALSGWEGDAGSLVPGFEDTPSLLIESTDATTSVNVRRELPVEALGTGLITLSAVVNADGVSEPPQPWNGIKVMLILEIDDGREYPQIPLGHGTFGWERRVHATRIPRGVAKATLILGLERASGKVWFDNVAIRKGRPVAAERRQEAFKGHNLPRLRGVMHGPQFQKENLRDLAQWGANQVRWQLNWVPMKEAEEWARDLGAYDRWLDGALADTDKAVEACEKYGLLMLLDLHCPPGGRAAGGVCRMFSEERYRDKLLSVWDRIAKRYKGRDVIYAYDLINEPVEPRSGGIVTWPELASQAIETIRAVDPGKPVVFEPGPWGGCGGFDLIQPLDDDRIIYSFHMYQPHEFTHQFRFEPSVYPGVIGGRMWDKERLREAMQPAIDFQRDFGVHIYVGEFSAIRWAPDNSAYRYVRDLIDLFEEYGWDWSYHAFREWDGWSVEHTTDKDDRNPSPTPTDREKLLRSWFAQNERPEL
jgi:endoglucanase